MLHATGCSQRESFCLAPKRSKRFIACEGYESFSGSEKRSDRKAKHHRELVKSWQDTSGMRNANRVIVKCVGLEGMAQIFKINYSAW